MKYMKKYFLIGSIFVFFGFLILTNDLYQKISKGIEIFGKTFKEISLNYVDEIDPEEFMLFGLKKMLLSLDPYTNFIEEDRITDIEIITTGKYGGVGATVGLRNDRVIIVDLFEGYSAQRQGLQIGDEIIKIDSTIISKDNFNDLGLYLKGEPGTEVTIIVKREGEVKDLNFVLVREQIEVKNLTYYGFIPENTNNVYLKLSGFTRTAGDEIKKAIIELQKQKEIKSIILDLRGNPGGLLDAAIDVSDKFLKKDFVIVSVNQRDEQNNITYKANEEPIVGDINLIVLIDGSSASASEIVAGAIQDNDRGIILGTQSFGKGLVQTIITLPYNHSLKITTGKYLTPSGRCIQKIDYSSNNKVFINQNTLLKKEFYTRNNRLVYSAGGILPDTIVTNVLLSNQINELIARGFFFRFASFYMNQNQNFNFEINNDQELFKKFKEYIRNQKFEYTSKSELLLAELTTISNIENYNEKVKEKIQNLLDELKIQQEKELDKFSSDVIIEIKKELAYRQFGRVGRITEGLKYDIQFTTALNIINNENLYHKILRVE
ncbi:MAG: S41 family peptidase [Ignavibacteriales bacterium]|nr:S41 family peptidase [Ignavibacteriales bacterium]